MKKGFTLIELLAVIIILAIVALIATPIILNVIEEARISAGRSEASMIYTGINNYCATEDMKYQLDNSYNKICTTSMNTDTVSQMVNLGNAIITSISYDGTKLTDLVIESNSHEFRLCGDGTFAMDDEECGVNPPIEEPEEDYNDNSGANKPELLDNMIPIKYDGSNWVCADTTEAWYNYDNQEWANAAVLNKGVTKNIGDTITEDEIALWYVWIPRYKYQLFNANNGSIAAQLINIQFESGTATTGTVSCTDAIATSGSSSETCTNASNGNWYTHPAFTFGEEEMTGFWVGKFEVSGSTGAITIKPNVSSLRSQTVSSFFTAIQNMSTTYSLNGDSHMMKNMEWGAVAYLKQSKYGLGTIDIGINNNRNYTTGCGSVAGSSAVTTCNAYNTSTGMLASTTGNIYGVYDMSGGTLEYIMGNIVNSSGAFHDSDAGFRGNIPSSKYYDRYTYGTSSTTHGRGKLGDATKETLLTFGGEYGGWYGDYSYLVRSDYSWFARGGGGVSGSIAGIFYFGYNYGVSNIGITTRAVLTPQ